MSADDAVTKPAGLAVVVCINRRLGVSSPSCAARGSEALVDSLGAAIERNGWPVTVETVRCFGECARGPNLRIVPGGAFFHGLSADDLDPVLAELARHLAAPGPAD